MAPSPTVRRLLKETAELSASSLHPNPTFHAAPVSDANLHEWHFTLLGPPSPSPYAGGLYHGRITLPTTYPLKPPNFRFLTPSGRFEVNREICLSISGFHEETWMPAWGVRTALTALRSFMAEKGSAGQVGGMEAKKEVREKLARESKGWKCEGCGGRSNEEIMREWWEICKERGVKVDEEISLEELPEGLSLEARDPKGKGKADDQQPDPSQLADPTMAISPNSPDAPASINAATAPSVPPPTQSAVQRSVQCAADPPRLAPQPEDTQSGPSTAPRPTPKNSPPQTVTGTPIPPITTGQTTATRTTPNPTNHNREELSTGTIDKAIGALVLALCMMILKKIFYPASGASQGMEGVYMSGD